MKKKLPPKCWHFYGVEGRCVKCGNPQKTNEQDKANAKVRKSSKQ
jgi:hypothetical protein